jgi:hypothetical protein
LYIYSVVVPSYLHVVIHGGVEGNIQALPNRSAEQEAQGGLGGTQGTPVQRADYFKGHIAAYWGISHIFWDFRAIGLREDTSKATRHEFRQRQEPQ